MIRHRPQQTTSASDGRHDNSNLAYQSIPLPVSSQSAHNVYGVVNAGTSSWASLSTALQPSTRPVTSSPRPIRIHSSVCSLQPLEIEPYSDGRAMPNTFQTSHHHAGSPAALIWSDPNYIPFASSTQPTESVDTNHRSVSNTPQSRPHPARLMEGLTSSRINSIPFAQSTQLTEEEALPAETAAFLLALPDIPVPPSPRPSIALPQQSEHPTQPARASTTSNVMGRMSQDCSICLDTLIDRNKLEACRA